MSASEIEEIVSDYVQSKIDENNLEAEIVGVVVSGSRCRGIEKAGSDLDVVLEYKGNVREDAFYDILHEDGMEIGGVKVDINPITEERAIFSMKITICGLLRSGKFKEWSQLQRKISEKYKGRMVRTSAHRNSSVISQSSMVFLSLIR